MAIFFLKKSYLLLLPLKVETLQATIGEFFSSNFLIYVKKNQIKMYFFRFIINLLSNRIFIDFREDCRLLSPLSVYAPDIGLCIYYIYLQYSIWSFTPRSCLEALVYFTI